jgi:acyl-CoA reductase-like NAD-dependent aldehyde dehydrogenase
VAVSVVVAVGEIGDALAERLAQLARSLKVSVGSDSSAEIGRWSLPNTSTAFSGLHRPSG